MTLDNAIEAFRDVPSENNAVQLRTVAQEYRDDEMISEQEMWDLIAWTDGGDDPWKHGTYRTKE